VSFTAAVVLVALLDLAVIGAVAAIMRLPFRLDRRPAAATTVPFDSELEPDVAGRLAA
jgi:hypothetical protein